MVTMLELTLMMMLMMIVPRDLMLLT